MRSVALITGASSGIGAEFARQLAKQRYELILVARRESLLRDLSGQLKSLGSPAVTVIAADLTDASDLTRVVGDIERLPPLDYLINNAGFGLQGGFAESDVDRQLEMVTLHIDATLRLTRAALPSMVARRQGIIINVSSVAGFVPLAGSTTYASTKAFLTAFSQALQTEVGEAGVRVQALCPGFTYSGFHESREYGTFDRSRVPKWLWMSAEQVVSASLAAAGKNKVVVIPGFKNRMIVAFSRSRVLSAIIRRRRRRMIESREPGDESR